MSDVPRGVATVAFLLGLVAIAWVATVLLRPAYPDPAAPDLVAAIAAGAELTEDQWAGLQTGAAAGNALALNNLGAALVLQRGDTTRAADLFRTAAFGPGAEDAPGRVQARYNLAWVLPGEEDADPEAVAEQLSALTANLPSGDLPSRALLAERLTLASRQDHLTEDRQDLQLRVIGEAAASGDPGWRLMAADMTWQAREGAPGRAAEAALLYEQVADEGLAEAALRLSEALSAAEPEVIARIEEAGIDPDPRHWSGIAARMGLDAGECRFALDVFAEDLARARQGPEAFAGDAPAVLPADAGPTMVELPGAQPEGRTDDPDRFRAIDWLADCAAIAERPEEPPTPPFAAESGAIYLGKVRPARTDVTTEPGDAALTLGAVLGYGLGGIPRDVPQAISALTVARDRHGLAEADALLGDLQNR